MPLLEDNETVLKSDVYNYKLFQNALSGYDTGREKGLESDLAHLPVDSKLLGFLKINETSTHPGVLKENTENIVKEYSKIFQKIKEPVIAWGDNIKKRDDMAKKWYKKHPQYRVRLSKHPLLQEFLMYLAGRGGYVKTSDLITHMKDDFEETMKQAMDLGYTSYKESGKYIELNPEDLSDLRDRIYGVPYTPTMERTGMVQKNMFMEVINILRAKDNPTRSNCIRRLEDMIVSRDLYDYIPESWVNTMVKRRIDDVYEFMETDFEDLLRWKFAPRAEIIKMKLNLFCYFRVDIKEQSIDYIDEDIYKNSSEDKGKNTKRVLKKRNNILTFNDIANASINTLDTYKAVSRLLFFITSGYANYMIDLTKKDDRFNYKKIDKAWHWFDWLPEIQKIELIKHLHTRNDKASPELTPLLLKKVEDFKKSKNINEGDL
jgi:hypothetical protein